MIGENLSLWTTLRSHWAGFVFNAFHQWLGKSLASPFWIVWIRKIDEWVGSASCSGGDVIIPQAMKYWVDG